jgi:hypothetical protein
VPNKKASQSRWLFYCPFKHNIEIAEAALPLIFVVSTIIFHCSFYCAIDRFAPHQNLPLDP